MKNEDIEYWFSTENGAHVPVRKGQTKEQALNEFLKDKDDARGKSVEELKNEQAQEQGEKKPGAKKLTPAEKIASVHIDFDRDNILPELNEEDLIKIGSKVNKPVLLKKKIIDRNAIHHKDAMNDTNKIIGETLYQPSGIFPGKSSKDYYTFIKPMRISKRNGLDEYGVVLIDVDNKNDNFEIVHWHWVNQDRIKSLKPNKKD